MFHAEHLIFDKDQNLCTKALQLELEALSQNMPAWHSQQCPHKNVQPGLMTLRNADECDTYMPLIFPNGSHIELAMKGNTDLLSNVVNMSSVYSRALFTWPCEVTSMLIQGLSMTWVGFQGCSCLQSLAS